VRQRAGAAGPARDEEARRKRKTDQIAALCVSVALLRRVTRFAGLSRAAAIGRPFVAPFLRFSV
jgi:hypothetical protein